jgi:hypothetical protein
MLRVYSSHTDRITTVVTIPMKNVRTCQSRHSVKRPRTRNSTYRTNGRAPTIMKNTAAHRMRGSSKKPKDLSWVEKPPVATVVMAWFTASNRLMPSAA